MNKLAMFVLCAAALLSTTEAMAVNELVVLTEDSALNRAEIAVAGNDNRLVISQDYTGSGGSNTLAITVNGDLNGGPLGATFSGPALLTGLHPGRFSQSGFDNTMTIEVNGTSNLFGFTQMGSGNTLRASITGHANQAAVLQSGTGNLTVFSQNGIGNIVSITQNSW